MNERLKQLLEEYLKWKQTYNFGKPRLRLNASILKEPLQFDINILPKEDFLIYLDRAAEFMSENIDDDDVNKFSQLEYDKCLQIIKYMKNISGF